MAPVEIQSKAPRSSFHDGEATILNKSSDNAMNIIMVPMAIHNGNRSSVANLGITFDHGTKAR